MLSKSDRGYDLAFDTARATKAIPPGLSAEQTIDDVVAHLLGGCQHHLLANQGIAEHGRDPEGVHQGEQAKQQAPQVKAVHGRRCRSRRSASTLLDRYSDEWTPFRRFVDAGSERVTVIVEKLFEPRPGS
jgi:hypothetical protein